MKVIIGIHAYNEGKNLLKDSIISYNSEIKSNNGKELSNLVLGEQSKFTS